MTNPIGFIVAFVAFLALIGVAALLVRYFAANRLGASTNRGRMPRLAVVDAAVVDTRRKLVLVRRDNVEHLLMIGGPSDIVVEPNIVRAMPARDQAPQRPAGAGEPPRIAPPTDTGWSDGDGVRSDMFDHAEPQMPEPPPRPARPSFADEVRRPAPTISRADRGDPLANFVLDPPAGGRQEPLGGRQEPTVRQEPLGGRPEPRPELRPEPMPSRVTSRSEPVLPRPPRPPEAPKPPARAPERAAAPPPPPAPSTADQNLAEMAQRLEAALRRPAGDAEPRVGAPPVAPEPPAARAPRPESPLAPPVAAPAKSGFENLEDEMASLLGRPKNSS